MIKMQKSTLEDVLLGSYALSGPVATGAAYFDFLPRTQITQDLLNGTVPISLYFFARVFDARTKGRKVAIAATSLGVASALELSRAYLGFGQYEPRNFLMYAIGAGLAFLLDLATIRKSYVPLMSRILEE